MPVTWKPKKKIGEVLMLDTGQQVGSVSISPIVGRWFYVLGDHAANSSNRGDYYDTPEEAKAAAEMAYDLLLQSETADTPS